MKPLKLGNFREPKTNESAAAYFKAAVFKMAKAKREFNESVLNRFVSTVIGRANKYQDLIDAYLYAVGRFKADGSLHLCADDLLEKAA